MKKNKRFLLLPIIAVAVFSFSQISFAQVYDREALKAELKEEILAEVNEQVWESPLLGAFKDVSLSGFLDVNYLYSFKQEDKSPRQNSLASGLNFIGENENNSVTFESFTLFLDKEATEENPIGWQMHTYFGEKAKAITFLGEATTSDPDRDDIFTVSSANVSWIAPVGKGIKFTFGKMYTWIGYELVENIGNPNYQHGTLYNNAIPFTHTGISASYDVSDTVSISLYGVNGWDSFIDNNSSKSFGWYATYTPTDKFFVSLAGIHGAEGWDAEKGALADQTSSSTEGLTQMVDLVATYQLTDKLGLVLNCDWGTAEDGALEPDAAGDFRGTGTTGHWWGVATYGIYDFNDWVQGVVRYEYFDDTDGVRFFDTSVWDVTGTVNIKMRENLLFRPEVRYINFAGNDGSDDEVIVGVGAEYLF